MDIVERLIAGSADLLEGDQGHAALMAEAAIDIRLLRAKVEELANKLDKASQWRQDAEVGC